MNRICLTLSALFVVACGADEPAPESHTVDGVEVKTKADARRAGKTDHGIDFCDVFGWYDDAVCDDFCPRPDPDCEAPDETCVEDADCPGGYCAYFATCLAIGCPPAPPPQCIYPNCDQGVALCEIVPPPADSCGAGNVVAVRDGCYTCVDAQTCDPVDPADPNECYEDSDCDNGTCLAAQCDPRGPCPANRCVPNPPEPQDECFEDADCAGAQVCLVAQCNPQGPCPANTCVDRTCGGLAGFRCGEDEYCAFPPEAMCGAADQTGICQPIGGDFCPQVYDPVCGCNGETYSNGCMAASAGVSVASAGACEPVVEACGTRGGIMCGDDEFCRFEGGHCGRADQGGSCQMVPELCTREFDPVCGCDGNTYSNACNAAARGVSVEHSGECR